MIVGHSEWTLEPNGEVLVQHIPNTGARFTRAEFAEIIAAMSERSRLGPEAQADARSDAWIVLSLNERDRDLGLGDFLGQPLPEMAP